MFLKKIAIIFISTFLASSVYAVDGTWTNTAGDRLWSNPNNWLGGIIASGSCSTSYFPNTISGTITNNYLSLTNSSFIMSNTTANLVITNGTNVLDCYITGTSTFNVVNSARTLTMGTELQGTNALLKIGAGTLYLSASNSFSGGVFINAGVIRLPTGATSNNLGNSGNVVTFTGNSSLKFDANTTLSQGFFINAGVTGTLDAYNFVITINNSLSGSGTLYALNGGDPGRSFTFTSTNNTFSGNIIIQNAANAAYFAELNMASLADTPGSRIRMGTSGSSTAAFTYGTNAVVPLVLSNRQIEHNGSGGILNNNATNVNCTVTVNTDLLLTGSARNTPFTLGGNNSGNNTFAGAITNMSSFATSLTKSGIGRWALGGTNTYSGLTTVQPASPAGVLIFQGSHALSPNTIIQVQDNSSSQGHIRFLSDLSGITDISTIPYQFRSSQSSAYGANTLTVGNNSTNNGGTNLLNTASNNIIYFGEYQSVPSNLGSSGDKITITNYNGYRVMFNGVKFTNLTASTRADFGIWFIPNGDAYCTITGIVSQSTGGNGTTDPYLQLDGTSASNMVTGIIIDPPDVAQPSKPIHLTKANTSTWTLSNSNSFGGDTIISGGTLSLAHSNALPRTTAVRMSTGTKLDLNYTGTNAIGVLTLNNVAQPIGTYGTNNVTYTNTTYFTGNGVLEIGAVDGVWTNLIGGLWSNTNNWRNGLMATGIASSAYFTNAVGVTVTNTSIGFVIGNMYFSNANYTITGGTNILNAGGNSVFEVGANRTVSIDTTLKGPSTLYKEGTGRLNINGSNECPITLNDGVLAINNINALGTNGFFYNGGSFDSTVTTNAGNPPQTWLANLVYIGSSDFNMGNGSVALTGNRTVTVSNNNLTVAGPISGAFSLTKSGSGTLTVKGTNVYTGTTTHNSGNFIIDGGGISNASSITINSSLGDFVVTNNAKIYGGAVVQIGNNTSTNTVMVVGGNNVTSLWNVGNANFGLGSGNAPAGINNKVIIDGQGVSASAIITNINILQFGVVAGFTSVNATYTLTNGGCMYVNSDVRLGSTYYNDGAYKPTNNTINIGGGTATSILSCSGFFYIGYGARSGCNNNFVNVYNNGVLTNSGAICYVGDVFNNSVTSLKNIYNNILTVSGGRGYVKALHVGYINVVNAYPVCTNSLIIANNGSVDATVLSVGYSDFAGATNFDNFVVITNGGQLTTIGTNFIGRTVAGGVALNNYVTIQDSLNGTNSIWNLSSKPLYVGLNLGTSTGNTLRVYNGGSATNISVLTVHTNNILDLGSGGNIYATTVTNVNGFMAVSIDDTKSINAGKLTVSGTMNISNCTLSVTNIVGNQPTYTIASYGSLLGNFTTTNGLPSGWLVNTNYNSNKQITLINPFAVTVDNVVVPYYKNQLGYGNELTR